MRGESHIPEVAPKGPVIQAWLQRARRGAVLAWDYRAEGPKRGTQERLDPAVEGD